MTVLVFVLWGNFSIPVLRIFEFRDCKGEADYKSVIYINFVEEPKYKLIMEDGYKTNDIIRNISRMDPSKKFDAGETIFLCFSVERLSEGSES